MDEFSNENNNKINSRCTSRGAVFGERFNLTIRDLNKKTVIEKGNANWIDDIPAVTEQNNNRKDSLTKLTPIQASLKKDMFIKIYSTKKELTPKFELGDLGDCRREKYFF